MSRLLRTSMICAGQSHGVWPGLSRLGTIIGLLDEGQGVRGLRGWGRLYPGLGLMLGNWCGRGVVAFGFFILAYWLRISF